MSVGQVIMDTIWKDREPGIRLVFVPPHLKSDIQSSSEFWNEAGVRG